MTNPFARIAFFMRSELREFQLAQAREIKQRYDCELHLYCGDPQQAAYYRKRNADGLFASVKSSGLYVLITVEGLLLAEALPRIWDPETQALFAAVMSFWFGSRTFQKMRGHGDGGR